MQTVCRALNCRSSSPCEHTVGKLPYLRELSRLVLGRLETKFISRGIHMSTNISGTMDATDRGYSTTDEDTNMRDSQLSSPAAGEWRSHNELARARPWLL